MIKNIDEGITYDYLAHGFGVILLVGGLGWLIHGFVSLLGLVIGIAIITMKGGVEVDLANKKWRKYNSFFGVKFGTWRSLANVNHVRISYESQDAMSAEAQTTAYMSANPVVGAVKCYEMIFSYSDNFNKDELVHSFTKMKAAFEMAKILKEDLNIEVTNYLLKMQGVLGKYRKR
ncbi:hypothetical protein K6119_00130 [Paracrocinitomix mangrovi]|uniref:hypothetical protein n=1 Tax=Paracrocinitomix mangrovi TaxID=2862509 RepID=UPI001C8CFC67|nr:hypothetical protein [Paracrocinitomix mangrovi]UKN01922.1 hypothetical protein K6119_00130 [Paracrocinitomix mangrovi]